MVNEFRLDPYKPNLIELHNPIDLNNFQLFTES